MNGSCWKNFFLILVYEQRVFTVKFTFNTCPLKVVSSFWMMWILTIIVTAYMVPECLNLFSTYRRWIWANLKAFLIFVRQPFRWEITRVAVEKIWFRFVLLLHNYIYLQHRQIIGPMYWLTLLFLANNRRTGFGETREEIDCNSRFPPGQTFCLTGVQLICTRVAS